MSKVVWALLVFVLVGVVSCGSTPSKDRKHQKTETAEPVTRERALTITDEELSFRSDDDLVRKAPVVRVADEEEPDLSTITEKVDDTPSVVTRKDVRVVDEPTYDDEEEEEEEEEDHTERDEEEAEDELDGLPDDKNERRTELQKRVEKSSKAIVKLYPLINAALLEKKTMLDRALEAQREAIAEVRRSGKGGDLSEHLKKLEGIGRAAAVMRDFFKAVENAKKSKDKRSVPEEVLAASNKDHQALKKTSDGFRELVEQVSGQLDVLNSHCKTECREFSELSRRLKTDSDGLVETQRAVERECEQLRNSLNSARERAQDLEETFTDDDDELSKKQQVKQVLVLENQRNKLNSEIKSLKDAVAELTGETTKIRETVSSLRVTVQSLSEARAHQRSGSEEEEVGGIRADDDELQRELVQHATQLQARVNQLELQRKKFEPVIATSRGVSSVASPWSPCSVIGCCTAER
eukprot:GILK01000685.1.p1 GENE.GILK01000685.1~~GILK01000685.1.p1  ORF type:complete len:466 (+),score=115.97 GILK01000685.1:36-1433(+)